MTVHPQLRADRIETQLGRITFLLVALSSAWCWSQIPKPNDAPLPLSAEESAACFTISAPFQMELIAAEPLIREPSGVCWDAHGRLFVCELHGYNLEGQYDIASLNQQGELDRVVRRVQADERFKIAAERETFGVIKLLSDQDGDGTADHATIWADRLPPCFGICPARGGLIAACQTQILFLADLDSNGTAEVREVLFEGFAKGPLERSVNCPQWGPDNWVYFGNGAGGGTIHGKYLTKPVELPRSDFRIRADGTAIEPVVGSTGTMGFAFTESGDRFVISTATPGIFVAPIEWRYLQRNPNVAVPRLEQRAMSDQRTWPTSQPHPWRTRRAEDPGFAKYYTDRYGVTESAPNGYFTSACSPLVYRDGAMPELRNQLLACEPAQNFVHRAEVHRSGTVLTLQRPADEQQSEFLASRDPWFHAISLAHAPDGSVLIVDFYREIIEDYSAIPRYLQQQYGLINGSDRGRLWRLKRQGMPSLSMIGDASTGASHYNMSNLTNAQLVAEIGSTHFWRRQTAKRLLLERQAHDSADDLAKQIHVEGDSATILNALNTLHDLHSLTSSETLRTALRHPDAAVRRTAIKLSDDSLLPANGFVPTLAESLADEILAKATDPDPRVRLQVALSAGQLRNANVGPTLAELARSHGADPWMATAILSSVSVNAADLLIDLLSKPAAIKQAQSLLVPLAQSVANGRSPQMMANVLTAVSELKNEQLQLTCLSALAASLREPLQSTVPNEAKTSLQRLTQHERADIRTHALTILVRLQLESAEEHEARMSRASAALFDLQASVADQLSAVEQFSQEASEDTAATLITAYRQSAEPVRKRIADLLVGRTDLIPALIEAIERQEITIAHFTAIEREAIVQSAPEAYRERARRLANVTQSLDSHQWQAYTSALSADRDLANGERMFRKHCATCHQAHDIGYAVGPDLSAEFQRAEETLVRDVLQPSESISAGYATYSLITRSGQAYSGLLADDSATSLTLRQAEGKEVTVLRKDLEAIKLMSVSLMPDDLSRAVTPKDLADTLGWLRRPSTRLVLFDESPKFADQLRQGEGTAQTIDTEAFSGRYCLQILPPQRYAARVPGWEFRIRETPGPGEYRYLRLAWKANGEGIMVELADDGHWPPADKALRRYHAGANQTTWNSVQVAKTVPTTWTVMTRDLWKDFGDMTLTGIAPTAFGGAAYFDHIELRSTTD